MIYVDLDPGDEDPSTELPVVWQVVHYSITVIEYAQADKLIIGARRLTDDKREL